MRDGRAEDLRPRILAHQARRDGGHVPRVAGSRLSHVEGAAQILLQAGRTVKSNGRSGCQPAATATPKAGQPEDVISMQMGDEDPIDLAQPHLRAHDLVLRAFAAVEEQAPGSWERCSASALTFRSRLGAPEPVPRKVIFMGGLHGFAPTRRPNNVERPAVLAEAGAQHFTGNCRRAERVSASGRNGYHRSDRLALAKVSDGEDSGASNGGEVREQKGRKDRLSTSKVLNGGEANAVRFAVYLRGHNRADNSTRAARGDDKRGDASGKTHPPGARVYAPGRQRACFGGHGRQCVHNGIDGMSEHR